MNNVDETVKKTVNVPFRKRKFDEHEFSRDDDDDVVLPKPKNKAEAMMAKMGFKHGRGLGKEQQGIAQPIEVEMRLSRRGLGHEKTALEPSMNLTWDEEEENIKIEESIDWAPECQLGALIEEESCGDWIKTGKKIDTIDQETEFISEETLRGVLDAKSVFDELDDKELRQARSRANPFESIKGAFFQNRAAMKMANLDAVFDFKLTNPDPVNDDSHETPPLFYFADVCAGPGGFTEYVLWKKNARTAQVKKTFSSPKKKTKKSQNNGDLDSGDEESARSSGEENSDNEDGSVPTPGVPEISVAIMDDDECPNFCPYSAHGFGFTLQGKDDFKLDKMLAACPEMFETHYGAPCATRADNRCGDGDVTNPQNLTNFAKFVQKVTGDRGVQLFMADGGFSVEGQENIQEILSKRLYLCQILCAFKILAKGGNLVCKLFDVFTPFSAGLLYLMWRSFDKICLHKPHTSRPANSERYVLAFGFRRQSCHQITEHLWSANFEYERLAQEKLNDMDVLELVPLDVLREANLFCDYLTQSNEKMARRQILFLNKYKIFARNKMLYDQRQSNIRSKCLTYWHIPDMPRPNSRGWGAENRLRELFGNDIDWLKNPVPTFQASDVNNLFDANNFLSYRCALTTKTPYLIVGLGGQQVQLWNSNRFDRAPQEFRIALPKDTVIFGEFTEEFDSEAKNPNRRPILRIFDACFLSGKDISKLPYYNSKSTDRVQQIAKFCKAINQEFSRCDLTIVRAVETIDFHTLYYGVRDRLRPINYRGDERLSFRNISHHIISNEQHENQEKEKFSDTFLHVNGLMCYKITADPWTIHYSKKKKAYFFYNKTLDPESQSTFNPPSDCFADFKQIFMNRKAIILPKHVRSATTTSNNDDSTSLNQFLHILKTIDSKNPMRGEHH